MFTGGFNDSSSSFMETEIKSHGYSSVASEYPSDKEETTQQSSLDVPSNPSYTDIQYSMESSIDFHCSENDIDVTEEVDCVPVTPEPASASEILSFEDPEDSEAQDSKRRIDEDDDHHKHDKQQAPNDPENAQQPKDDAVEPYSIKNYFSKIGKEAYAAQVKRDLQRADESIAEHQINQERHAEIMLEKKRKSNREKKRRQRANKKAKKIDGNGGSVGEREVETSSESDRDAEDSKLKQREVSN
jgi:hypothetical protein